MEKNKKTLNYVIACLTSLKTVVIIGLLIFYMIKVLNANQYDDDGELVKLDSSQKGLVYFAFISMIIAITFFAIAFVIYFIFDYENKIKLFCFSIVTFSIEGIICSSIMIKKSIFYFNKNSFKVFKNWRILDITLIGLLLGLYLLIDFISGFVPTLPFWITISLKYIILYFGAYILPISCTFTLCMLAAFMTILIPTTAAHTFIQYLFDYWIPTLCFFVAGFFKPNETIKNIYYQVFSWFIFVISPIFILYFCRVLSGVLYWLNPNAIGDDVFYSFVWNGRWSYSVIYNSFNTITDYVTLQILVPPICKSLSILRKRYFDNREIYY
ncbi:energy-coupled thiamine transporter ThiT [Spiroplasma tabanidicola]|uniref:Thiamine transporter n=1 Tax=Spiroplasma tabanidicola TaxID=324079 RepID=A0A6I6C7C2_9MOLU|nr:energy-coupled thiamine transporter ThiT [Spiroplasma tabanidicola]QGS51696.1 thiamine transporter [Spiroplasma tabanidicola]